MNIYTSGKLGDFIHTLYVVKYYSQFDKINVYYGSEFLEGLDLYESFNNLYDFVISQSYVNSFQIYNNEWIDVNTCDFRYHEDIDKIGFTDLFLKTFNIKKIKNNYLESEYDNKYKDIIIIHRSVYKYNDNFPWENILNKFENKLFVSINYNDYLNFPYKNNLNYLKIENIKILSKIINSCKLFIGNESLPFAIAHGLDKPRIVEIHSSDHRKHWYPDEIKYSNNINFYFNENLQKMNLING